MRYEKVMITNRIDLLTKIESFLSVCGWDTHRKTDEILYVTDSLGGGLVFKFIPYKDDPNYGYSERSSIYVCKSIDNELGFNAQKGSSRVAYFRCQNSKIELGATHLIADDKTFTIYIDMETASIKQNLLFTSGYITKSHEFNGGRVVFSSMRDYYNGGYNWGGYYEDNLGSSSIPFSQDSKTIFTLGGENRHLLEADLRDSLFLTNLLKVNTSQTSIDYNQLSALSAVPLLDIGKSALSGLYTLVTPNFFYKNNQNVFVHAGSYDAVRVLRDEEVASNRFKNGQILHLGDEKFVILRPHLPTTSNGKVYTMAVKIA